VNADIKDGPNDSMVVASEGSHIKLALVAGVAQNGVIGSEGAMPWRLPTDLKRFKAITMGKPVIMGRKTFQSIGKALPGRLNVVVSRSKIKIDGVVGADSVEKAVEISRQWATQNKAEEICVIGGGEIYRQALEYADRLYITHILAEPPGDTLFVPIEEANWRIISQEKFAKGEKDTAETIFVIYERNTGITSALGH